MANSALRDRRRQAWPSDGVIADRLGWDNANRLGSTVTVCDQVAMAESVRPRVKLAPPLGAPGRRACFCAVRANPGAAARVRRDGAVKALARLVQAREGRTYLGATDCGC